MSRVASTTSDAAGLRRPAFLSSAALYTLGNFAQRATVFLLVPLYTRFLTPEEFGAWALLTSIAAVLHIVVDFGVSHSVLRFYFDYVDDADRLRSYLRGSFVLRLVATVLVSLLVVLIAPIVWGVLTRGQVARWPFLQLIVLWSAAESLTLMVTTVYRARGDVGGFILAKCGQAVLQLLLAGAMVSVAHWGLLGAIGGQCAGALIIAIIVALGFGAENLSGGAQVNRADVLHSLTYGLPLVAHQLGWWVRNAADPIVLAQFVALDEVAVYHLGYLAGVILGVALHSVDFAYAPHYLRITTVARPQWETIGSYAGAFIGAAGLLALAGALFARQVVFVGLESNYWHAARIAPPVLLGYYLNALYMMYVKPLVLRKRTRLIPLLTFLPSFAGVCLNVILVPVYGIDAAAWTTAATFAVIAAGTRLATWRIDSAVYSSGTLGILTVVVAVVCATAYVRADLAPSLIETCVSALLLCIVARWVWQSLLARGLDGARRLADHAV